MEAVPTSKVIWGQGCTPALPEGPFPMIFPLPSLLVSPFPQGTGDGEVPAIPQATAIPPKLQEPGLTPGLPILLQPQLEHKAQKIPVDPQAMEWKLYFNKQKERAFSPRSSALDESENKIPVPK